MTKAAASKAEATEQLAAKLFLLPAFFQAITPPAAVNPSQLSFMHSQGRIACGQTDRTVQVRMGRRAKMTCELSNKNSLSVLLSVCLSYNDIRQQEPIQNVGKGGLAQGQTGTLGTGPARTQHPKACPSVFRGPVRKMLNSSVIARKYDKRSPSPHSPPPPPSPPQFPPLPPPPPFPARTHRLRGFLFSS
jgi:hypothetical protein